MSTPLASTMSMRWDVASGATSGEPLQHAASVWDVAIEPDGTLYSAGWDGAVLRWDLDPGKWDALACEVAARNLTPGEWQAFLGAEAYRETCPEVDRPGA